MVVPWLKKGRNTIMNKQDHARLIEIQEEMINLLSEAKDLIRCSDNKMAYERAKSYWMAHVEMGLSNDHYYASSSMCSMEDTIKELEPSNEADSDDDDEEWAGE